jgi:hypothetical protein
VTSRRERRPVRFGALLWPQRTTWAELREAATRAVAAGVDSLWTWEIKGVERRDRARLVPPEEREAALGELRARMGGFAERADWGDLFVLEPEP